jgi:hypothetical protein
MRKIGTFILFTCLVLTQNVFGQASTHNTNIVGVGSSGQFLNTPINSTNSNFNITPMEPMDLNIDVSPSLNQNTYLQNKYLSGTGSFGVGPQVTNGVLNLATKSRDVMLDEIQTAEEAKVKKGCDELVALLENAKDERQAAQILRDKNDGVLANLFQDVIESIKGSIAKVVEGSEGASAPRVEDYLKDSQKFKDSCHLVAEAAGKKKREVYADIKLKTDEEVRVEAGYPPPEPVTDTYLCSTFYPPYLIEVKSWQRHNYTSCHPKAVDNQEQSYCGGLVFSFIQPPKPIKDMDENEMCQSVGKVSDDRSSLNPLLELFDQIAYKRQQEVEEKFIAFGSNYCRSCLRDSYRNAPGRSQKFSNNDWAAAANDAKDILQDKIKEERLRRVASDVSDLFELEDDFKSLYADESDLDITSCVSAQKLTEVVDNSCNTKKKMNKAKEKIANIIRNRHGSSHVKGDIASNLTFLMGEAKKSALEVQNESLLDGLNQQVPKCDQALKRSEVFALHREVENSLSGFDEEMRVLLMRITSKEIADAKRFDISPAQLLVMKYKRMENDEMPEGIIKNEKHFIDNLTHFSQIHPMARIVMRDWDIFEDNKGRFFSDDNPNGFSQFVKSSIEGSEDAAKRKDHLRNYAAKKCESIKKGIEEALCEKDFKSSKDDMKLAQDLMKNILFDEEGEPKLSVKDHSAFLSGYCKLATDVMADHQDANRPMADADIHELENLNFSNSAYREVSNDPSKFYKTKPERYDLFGHLSRSENTYCPNGAAENALKNIQDIEDGYEIDNNGNIVNTNLNQSLNGPKLPDLSGFYTRMPSSSGTNWSCPIGGCYSGGGNRAAAEPLALAPMLPVSEFTVPEIKPIELHPVSITNGSSNISNDDLSDADKYLDRYEEAMEEGNERKAKRNLRRARRALGDSDAADDLLAPYEIDYNQTFEVANNGTNNPNVSGNSRGPASINNNVNTDQDYTLGDVFDNPYQKQGIIDDIRSEIGKDKDLAGLISESELENLSSTDLQALLDKIVSSKKNATSEEDMKKKLKAEILAEIEAEKAKNSNTPDKPKSEYETRLAALEKEMQTRVNNIRTTAPESYINNVAPIGVSSAVNKTFEGSPSSGGNGYKSSTQEQNAIVNEVIQNRQQVINRLPIDARPPVNEVTGLSSKITLSQYNSSSNKTALVEKELPVYLGQLEEYLAADRFSVDKNGNVIGVYVAMDGGKEAVLVPVDKLDKKMKIRVENSYKTISSKLTTLKKEEQEILELQKKIADTKAELYNINKQEFYQEWANGLDK